MQAGEVNSRFGQDYANDFESMLSAELDLNRGWAIGEGAFSFLTQDIEQLNPGCIVEFGSGASSIRLAMRFPDSRVLSIDHSQSYCDNTIGLKNRYAPNSNLQVSFRPLTWQFHGFGCYRSYEVQELPPEIDAVIIDGPPSSTLRGREACLYQIASKLRIGGRVYLDDFSRPAEKQMAQNWESAFPGSFKKTEIAVDHHICVFEKIRRTDHPLPRVKRMTDSGLQALRVLRATVRNAG